MNGYPGGYEDEFDFDDDEYDFDGEYRSGDSKPYMNNTQQEYENTEKRKQYELIAALKPQFSLKSEDMKAAILKNNIDYVKKCLDNGYQTEMLMHSGWTALMYASTNACSLIVKILIDRGANVNFEKDLFTPLMAACYSTCTNEEQLLLCVKCLVEHHAKVNTHDRLLMTPIMYATKNGFSKIVKYLCEMNADVNKQDCRGWTVLHFGASKGFTHVVKVLLQNQADANIGCFDGQLPCDVAFAKGFIMLSEMLENYHIDNHAQYDHILDKLETLKESSGSKYVIYDEMELFLHGLEVGHVIKYFKEHHLEFTDLLKIQDSELLEIGIKELGTRKKILQAVRDVHSNQWDMKSLKSSQEINKLTTVETAALIANISKHLGCINSSVEYVINHLKRNKDILASDECSHQKLLIEQLKESTRITNSLQKSISSLNKQALQVFPKYNEKAVNLIEKYDKNSSLKKSYIKPAVLTSIVVVSSIACVYIAISRNNGSV